MQHTTTKSAMTHPAADFLRRQCGQLYALLDAARDPRVLALLQSSGEWYQSLYEGPQGDELAAFAPYLVQLPAASRLFQPLLEQGWGQSWGVFLSSRQPFADVRKHFRRFLLVRFEDGREAYFRFYDPRVLRLYLPTCTAVEIEKFFGPVAQFLVEAERPGTALRFTAEPRGLGREVVSLTPASPAGPWETGRVAYPQHAMSGA